MATTVDFATLLFKKNLNAPSTLDTTAVFSEPNRPALPAVYQSQIFAEKIPSTAPSDIANATTDDLGASLAGSYAGKTSTASPMIRKYVKIALTVVPGTQDNAYEAQLDPTYGRVLQNTVPYNNDPIGSYLYNIYKNDGVTPIVFGMGSWVLDTTSGILTFYAYNAASLGISAASPPKVSFYRYVGAFGAATAAQTQSQITGSALTFTKQETFSGGSTTALDDTLAAIMVDTRNLNNIASTSDAMALQFGGNFDGSWRVVVSGAQGESQGSSFQIQVRIAGAWQTKGSFWST